MHGSINIEHFHHHHHHDLHYYLDDELVSNAQAQPAVNAQQPAQSAPVEVPQPSSVSVEQPHQHMHQQYAHVASPSYYHAPAGLMTVVSDQQGVANKPAPVRNFEQYGQPESASIPANYKPFGSWGLYIGGNPADGYYTNYYKALSNSLDKQQQPATQDQSLSKPAQVVPTAALSPLLRQASSSPYVGNSGDYYSFAYSPADLSSASRAAGLEHAIPAHAPISAPLSPVQAGAQVYGSPASFESNYGVSPYADSYATKKVGSVYAQKEMPKEAPVVQQPTKSAVYQSRVYVYPSPVVSGAQVVPVHASAQGIQSAMVSQPQQHVVAYPVPVGSQIVGSQPGVEGSFNPYGIHAFTRYAVKPTVVNHDQSYYYGVSQASGAVPSSYKQVQYASYVPAVGHYQHQHQHQHQHQPSYYPFSFYGYPLNQLHYSQGSVMPSAHGSEQHAPAQSSQVDGVFSSEKVEKDDKPVVNMAQQN